MFKPFYPKLFKVDSEHQFHAVMLESKARCEFSRMHFRFYWIKLARLKNIVRYDCPNFRKVECLFTCNYSSANVTFSAKLATKRLILHTLLKCAALKLQALYLGTSSLQRCKLPPWKCFSAWLESIVAFIKRQNQKFYRHCCTSN